MFTRRSIWVLLPFLLLGCEQDNNAVQPRVPLTADEQVAANCRAIRDALETYAASHGGSYGEYDISLNDLGLDDLKNPYSEEIEPSGLRAQSPGQIGLETYQCNGTVFGYRITGHGRDRMLITLESLENVPADVRYAHDVTVANAFLTMDAAKVFAAANGGVFPQDVSDLVDLLPNGELLINPFSSAQVNPQDGGGLGDPGAIGYSAFDARAGTLNAFIIEAYACDGLTIMTLLPFTQFGEFVYGDCYELRQAVEEFAEDSGHYPHDLDTETTPGGKTVFDLRAAYLHGTDFVNPYTKEHYYPSIGVATGKGEIAYQPIETAGVVTSYTITGRDVFEEIVRIRPMPAP